MRKGFTGAEILGVLYLLGALVEVITPVGNDVGWNPLKWPQYALDKRSEREECLESITELNEQLNISWGDLKSCKDEVTVITTKLNSCKGIRSKCLPGTECTITTED